jgi:hypothetical protein
VVAEELELIIEFMHRDNNLQVLVVQAVEETETVDKELAVEVQVAPVVEVAEQVTQTQVDTIMVAQVAQVLLLLE